MNANTKMSTKKRKVYDVQTKQNIIDDFNNKEKNKETIDDIMKKYDIRTTSTFYTIINPKNQEKLKNVMYNELRPPTTKKIKLAIYPDVEKAMEMWFKEVKKN